MNKIKKFNLFKWIILVLIIFIVSILFVLFFVGLKYYFFLYKLVIFVYGGVGLVL